MKVLGMAALAAIMGVIGGARADVIYMPGAGQCLTVTPRNGQIRDWSPIVLAPCNGGPTQQFSWNGKSYQYAGDSRLCIGWHKFRDDEPYPLGLEFCYQDRTFVRPDANGRVYGASSAEAAKRCWVPTPPHANLTSTVGLGPCGASQFRTGTLQQATAGKTTTTTTTTQPKQGLNQTPDQPNVVFTPVQNVGPWVIQKAYLNNKFDRCRAELGRDDNMLLIVKWASRKWGLAIINRGLAIGSKHDMEVEMDRASELFKGVIDSTAAWFFSFIPDQTVAGLRSVSRIQVKAPFGVRSWNTPSISAAIGAVEDCFNANIGNAGNAGKTGNPPAPPPSKEVYTRVATVGQWRIVHVYKGGKFDRCRAELGSGAQQINIVKWASSRAWGLSIPARGLKAGSKHQMEIEMGRASNPVIGTVDPSGSNLTGPLSNDILNYLRSTGTLQVSTPTNNGTFSLTGIGAATGAVEDCFNTNIGNAG